MAEDRVDEREEVTSKRVAEAGPRRKTLSGRSISGKFLELASDSLTYGASSVIARVIGFLLLPLYTRYLTTSDYGALAMFHLLLALFVPIAALGMPNATFRRFNVSKDHTERERVFGTALVSIVLGAVVLFALGMVFLAPLTRLLVDDESYTPLVRMTLISALATALSRPALVMLRADRRARLTATINLARVVVSVGLTVWLVVVAGRGIGGVVLALLITDLSVLPFLYGATLKSFRPRPTWRDWKPMASYGLPFVPHMVQMVGITYFGLYMVRYMLDLDEAGIYNVAMRFAAPAALLTGAIQTAWAPFKFQIHAEDEAPAVFFRTALTYYVFGVTLIWTPIAVWGPEIVRWMTAPAYHDGAALVPLLTAIPLARGVYQMAGTGFELGNDTRVVPLVSFVGLIFVISTAVLLIPWVGAYGAGLATLTGWLVMGCLAYRVSQKRFAIDYDWPTIGILFATAAAIAATSTLIQSQPVGSRVLFGTAVTVIFPAIAVGSILLGHTDSEPLLRLWALVRRSDTSSR